MLRVVFNRVKPDQLGRLREWMGEVMARPDEVRQTFAQEGVRHEQAYLLASAEGPVLVYAIELEDEDRARQAYERSTLPIDLEHRRTMQHVLAGPAAVELLYDLQQREPL